MSTKEWRTSPAQSIASDCLPQRSCDPFSLFKSAAGEPGDVALEYNRRHRRMLLPYIARWLAIALACLAGLYGLSGTSIAAALPLEAILAAGYALAVSMILGASTAFALLAPRQSTRNVR